MGLDGLEKLTVGKGHKARPQTGWRLIRHAVRPYRGRLILAVLISVIAAVPALFGPLLIGHAVDAIKTSNEGELERIAALLAGLAVLTALLAALRMVLVTRVSYRIESSIRERYFDQILDLDLATIERLDPGQLVARGTSDLRAIRIFFSSGIPTIAQAAATFIFVAVALLIEEAALSSIAFAMAITIVVIAHRQANAATALQHTVRKKVGKLTNQIEEALDGITVIKAFGRESERVLRFRKALHSMSDAVQTVAKRDAIYNATLGAIPLIGLTIVMVVGGNLAIEGEALSQGEFVTFFMYFLMMAWPAVALGQVTVLAQDSSAAGLRIEDILKLPVKNRADGDRSPVDGGKVALREARASYDSENEVVQGLDLTVPAGGFVALVGANGSGKSMALSLVKDLYPLQSGTLEIGGVPASELSSESLQNSVGIVFDEDFLFDASVREAISYGRPDATQEQIEAVAKAACAHSFIERLPHGYDTRIGEKGVMLSGGQRQRIAFARALLVEPDVILSDDASASLDTPTANALAQSITGDPNRAALIVSRRPSVLEQADSVALMDDGKIVDHGTHQELMERSELYRSITSGGYNKATDEVPQSVAAPVAKKSKVVAHKTKASSSAIAKAEPKSKSKLAHAKLLWRDAKPDRRLLIFAAVALTLMTAASLAPAWLSGRVVDDVLGAGNSAELDELALLLIGASLIWAVASGFAHYLVPWIGQRTMTRLRDRLFSHLMRVPMTYYDTASPGKVLAQLIYILEILGSVFRQSATTLMTSVLMMVGTGIVLFVIDPLLALIVYATIPFILLLSRLLAKMRQRANRHSLSGMTALTQNMLEAIRGIRVIHSFGTEQRQREQFAQFNTEERLSLRRAAYAIGGFSLLAELVMGLALAVMVLIGGRQAIEGTIAVGTMVALTMYLRMALSPVSELATTAVSFGQVGPAIDSASHLLGVREEKRPELSAEPGCHLDTVRGAVKVEQVSFA